MAHPSQWIADLVILTAGAGAALALLYIIEGF